VLKRASSSQLASWLASQSSHTYCIHSDTTKKARSAKSLVGPVAHTATRKKSRSQTPAGSRRPPATRRPQARTTAAVSNPSRSPQAQPHSSGTGARCTADRRRRHGPPPTRQHAFKLRRPPPSRRLAARRASAHGPTDAITPRRPPTTDR
jgi:hypothetical protein